MTTIGTPITPTEFGRHGDHLERRFRYSADWRSGLSKRYRSDDRNFRAAEELMVLADTVTDIPPALMKRYLAVCLRDDLIDKENEMRKAVGFHAYFANATEFVEALLG